MNRKTVVDSVRATPVAALQSLFTFFGAAVCKTKDNSNGFAQKTEENAPASRRNFLGLNK
jgi:hypothetical protein